MGSSFPDQILNPPSVLEGRFLITGPSRKFQGPDLFFFFFDIYLLWPASGLSCGLWALHSFTPASVIGQAQ